MCIIKTYFKMSTIEKLIELSKDAGYTRCIIEYMNASKSKDEFMLKQQERILEMCNERIEELKKELSKFNKPSNCSSF